VAVDNFCNPLLERRKIRIIVVKSKSKQCPLYPRKRTLWNQFAGAKSFKGAGNVWIYKDDRVTDGRTI
jgi:hypothetical protein